jgi:hypothetical protein
VTKPERRPAGAGVPTRSGSLGVGVDALDAAVPTGVRPWRQRAALPLGLLLLTALGSGVVWLRLQLAIERCIDAGGKWASIDRRCTFAEPIEPEPMLARPAGTTVKSPAQ